MAKIITSLPQATNNNLQHNNTLNIQGGIIDERYHLTNQELLKLQELPILGYIPEDISNKQNSLVVDGTGVKFPTVDAVNTIGLQKVLDVNEFVYDKRIRLRSNITNNTTDYGNESINLSNDNDRGIYIGLNESIIDIASNNEGSVSLSALNGLSLGEIPTGRITNVKISAGQIGDINLLTPIKATGTYTLATTDDIVATDLSDFYTKTEIDTKVSSVYKFKGNVANYAALPSTGLTAGDVYNLSDTGANYAWTGTVWDDLGTTVDISGKENVSNKSQDIETDKASTTKYASVKQLYEWAVAKFQAGLVSGTNIKTINGASLLGSGDITVSGGGGGDMVLASTQTVSGLKTFLSGMFGLRNVANTFTSYFTNANTAARTYTLPDKNGSIPVDSDIVHIAGNETISGIKSFSTKIIVMADVADPYAESMTVVQNATAGGAFYIKNNANNVFLGGFSMANNDLRFANYVSTGKVLFYSNGMDRIAIFPSGNIQIKSTINGTATDDTINKLQVDGSIKATQFRLSTLNTAPSSSADTGTTGEIRFDANYMYVCVATNTWKRSELTTW